MSTVSVWLLLFQYDNGPLAQRQVHKEMIFPVWCAGKTQGWRSPQNTCCFWRLFLWAQFKATYILQHIFISMMFRKIWKGLNCYVKLWGFDVLGSCCHKQRAACNRATLNNRSNKCIIQEVWCFNHLERLTDVCRKVHGGCTLMDKCPAETRTKKPLMK